MMRIKALITSAMMGSMTLLSHAQEAAPPSVDLYSGQKQPEVVAATTSLEPTAPGVPELSQLDEAFRKTSLGKEAGESRLQEAGKAIARSR
jgi:hypothetical protein